jgi:hypothetical protein
MQRILARIKAVGAARVVRTTSFQFELTMRGQAILGAQNMDVIEKRGNRNLNVCEIGFPSRQKTGSAFQVYGAMRSANVKSRRLSDMTIRPCRFDG